MGETLRHTRSCVILIFSGCATMIGFILGVAFAIIWEVIG